MAATSFYIFGLKFIFTMFLYATSKVLYDIGNAEGLLVLDADVRFPFYGFGLGETKMYYLK